MRESNIKRVKNYSKRKPRHQETFDSKTPRARTHACEGESQRMRYRIAGAYARTIINECFGNERDFRIWAWYCYNFDREAIKEKAIALATEFRGSNSKDAIAIFQHWLTKKFGAKPLCI